MMMQKLLAALFADQKKQCPFSRDNRPLTDVEIEEIVRRWRTVAQ
jgi:hypothetical protein